MTATENNPVKKYAIVVAGSSYGEKGSSLNDPIDKNYNWLNLTLTYKHLQELNFDEIEILYSDADPDFNEKLNAKVVKEIKQKYMKKSPLLWNASIKNLERLVDEFAKKVDDNDLFVLVISTHGDPRFLEMAASEDLSYLKLNRIVKKVNPGYGIIYIDACHSGPYIKKLKGLDSYVMISTTGDYYGWGDRTFSGSSYFFENLTDPEADKNVDGFVTIQEAFNRAKKEAVEHMQRIEHYLLKEYNWDESGNSSDLLKQVSVIPTIIVGKNVSKEFYLLDYLYFIRK